MPLLLAVAELECGPAGRHLAPRCSTFERNTFTVNTNNVVLGYDFGVYRSQTPLERSTSYQFKLCDDAFLECLQQLLPPHNPK